MISDLQYYTYIESYNISFSRLLKHFHFSIAIPPHRMRRESGDGEHNANDLILFIFLLFFRSSFRHIEEQYEHAICVHASRICDVNV